MAQEIKIDRELDCKGTLCPMPIIDTKRAIDKMEKGQVLKMEATDPGSKSDMESWSRKTGHKLLQTSEEAGVFVFFVQKS